MLIATTTGLPVLSFPTRLKIKIRQICDIGITCNVDVTTTASISAIRAALRLVFRASKAETAVTAFTRLKADINFIVKQTLFSAQDLRNANLNTLIWVDSSSDFS